MFSSLQVTFISIVEEVKSERVKIVMNNNIFLPFLLIEKDDGSDSRMPLIGESKQNNRKTWRTVLNVLKYRNSW